MIVAKGGETPSGIALAEDPLGSLLASEVAEAMPEASERPVVKINN
ncbi:hypothetical protein [Evansella clarkii]|nr:hypothetical protein [Evansella clarkii]